MAAVSWQGRHYPPVPNGMVDTVLVLTIKNRTPYARERMACGRGYRPVTSLVGTAGGTGSGSGSGNGVGGGKGKG